MAITKKTNAGEDVWKGESLCTVIEVKTDTDTVEISVEVSQKAEWMIGFIFLNNIICGRGNPCNNGG